MFKPDWYYNDLRQIGVDFDDEAQVASYDDRQGQGTDADDKLLRELGLERRHIMADLGCAPAF